MSDSLIYGFWDCKQRCTASNWGDANNFQSLQYCNYAVYAYLTFDKNPRSVVSNCTLAGDSAYKVLYGMNSEDISDVTTMSGKHLLAFTSFCKQNQKRAIVSIGGPHDVQMTPQISQWNEIGDDLVSYITNLVNIYGIDGLDFNWEYLSSTQDCNNRNIDMNISLQKCMFLGYLMKKVLEIKDGYFIVSYSAQINTFMNYQTRIGTEGVLTDCEGIAVILGGNWDGITMDFSSQLKIYQDARNGKYDSSLKSLSLLPFLILNIKMFGILIGLVGSNNQRYVWNDVNAVYNDLLTVTSNFNYGSDIQIMIGIEPKWQTNLTPPMEDIDVWQVLIHTSMLSYDEQSQFIGISLWYVNDNNQTNPVSDKCSISDTNNRGTECQRIAKTAACLYYYDPPAVSDTCPVPGKNLCPELSAVDNSKSSFSSLQKKIFLYVGIIGIVIAIAISAAAFFVGILELFIISALLIVISLSFITISANIEKTQIIAPVSQIQFKCNNGVCSQTTDCVNNICYQDKETCSKTCKQTVFYTCDDGGCRQTTDCSDQNCFSDKSACDSSCKQYSCTSNGCIEATDCSSNVCFSDLTKCNDSCAQLPQQYKCTDTGCVPTTDCLNNTCYDKDTCNSLCALQTHYKCADGGCVQTNASDCISETCYSEKSLCDNACPQYKCVADANKCELTTDCSSGDCYKDSQICANKCAGSTFNGYKCQDGKCIYTICGKIDNCTDDPNCHGICMKCGGTKTCPTNSTCQNGNTWQPESQWGTCICNIGYYGTTCNMQTTCTL